MLPDFSMSGEPHTHSGPEPVRIHHLYVSRGHNYFGHHLQPAGENPPVEMTTVECVAGCGIRGDRFFNFKENYKGQITFFAMETLEQMKQELKLASLNPFSLRRNVFVSGADLKEWVGREFTVQGLQFQGVEECRPCYWMDSAVGPGAEEWLRGRGGLRARILNDGVLQRDTVAKFSAVVLAGGASRRMGSDKAWLKVGEHSLLATQVQRAVALGAREVFISGRADKCYEIIAKPVLLDRKTNCGPLAGIEHALDVAAENLVLILAVDMPWLKESFLRWLMSQCEPEIGVVPMILGELEPLAAVYPKRARMVAMEMLNAGRLSARRFAAACAEAGLVRRVAVPELWWPCFANWNTPDDVSASTAGF